MINETLVERAHLCSYRNGMLNIESDTTFNIRSL